MQTVTRRIQFCAGHRLLGHEGKCADMHGHNYVALITVEAEELDQVGRVVDFSVIQHVVGGWIETYWDHGFIYNKHDEAALAALACVAGKSFGMNENPTAENMARLLLGVAELHLPDTLRAVKVRLWETENCYAEVVA